MATRTWNGTTADWDTDADWTPASPGLDVPLPGDIAIIGGGTVILTTNGAASDQLFENDQVRLGGAGARLLLRNTRKIGRFFNVAVTGSATIEADGVRGFAASITGAPNDGSVITVKADPGGNLILLNGGVFNVTDKTVDFEGSITLERDAMVSGDIVNNGTLSVLSGTTTFATNGLTGTGTIAIGTNGRFFVSGFQFLGASQTITFSGLGGTLGLAYNTPGNFTGTVRNFAPGDFIDFVGNGAATTEAIDTVAHTLTIKDGSGASYLFSNFYGAAGALSATTQSNGHDLIGYAAAAPQVAYQIGTGALAMHADVARTMTVPGTGALITGAGVKIGIISNSFDVNKKAASDIANGYLPASGVTVLREGATGQDDEGRAMAELIYQVAPGASLYFASTGSGVADFATSVQALQAAGCTVIVDDIGLGGEPFFQLGSAAENAISAAIAAGVTCVSSAGNYGDACYQHAFTTTQQTLFDNSSVQAMTFGNGTPYQSITAIGGLSDTIDLQWDAPFYGTGGVASDQPDSVVFKIFNSTTNALVGTSTQVSQNGHLVAESELTLPFASSNTTYNVAIYHAVGTPSVGQIKYVITGSGTGLSVGGRINDPDAGIGSGTIQGHQLVPGVITVAATDVTNTAAFGQSPDFTESFSSNGPGTLLFDATGSRYAQPVTVGAPDVTGPDGIQTSVASFTPFYGTSAAAPSVAGVVALLQQLEPGLAPASIASILAKSSLQLSAEPDSLAGAGLVQADRAVTLAAQEFGATTAVSVATFVANQPSLDKIAGGFAVADTAANVMARQALLEADPHITTITAKSATTLAVETFNIQGQAYTSTIYTSDLAGNLLSARYGGVKGQAYQGFESDYSDGIFTGTQLFYTGITGKPYTTETLSVNAAGQQTAVAYGGVSGQPYSAYEYDFANGLFAGSTFTYTAVPSGATYSSYDTDYDFASTYLGASFFYAITGQPYSGEEVDTTPAGATTRVLLTGFTTQPYQTLELDYTAGAYSGYKTFATGITGQSYTGLEDDVTAAGKLTKVVYTGLKGTPYTTLEQDYVNGALASSVFTFKAPAGQTYTSYAVTQNAAGSQVSETVNNTNGSHTIFGSASNLIFESIGNDQITGGGSGETFSFRNVFGHDTITDFSGHTTGVAHDTIALQTADFGSFAAVTSSAQNVTGGVAFTGKSGSQITISGLDKTTLAGLSADFAFRA